MNSRMNICDIAYTLWQSCVYGTQHVAKQKLYDTGLSELVGDVHIYIRDDHGVIYTQSFKFTHCTKYGSTYLASPIVKASSIQSLDDGVRSV